MKFTQQQFIDLKQAYDQGDNLRELILSWGLPMDLETISIIYELESGTYTKYSNENPLYIDAFTSEIVCIMSKYLQKRMSLLDCGTGEATTLIPILKKLDMRSGYAIDASISRLLWAQQNAVAAKVDLKLAVSDIGNLPLLDNSVDAVLTVHALESNLGREIQLIRELGRVARRFMFLIEPDFENSSKVQKKRMTKLNYIRNIDTAIKKNSFKILDKVHVTNNANELNSSSITVVDTGKSRPGKSNLTWVGPIYKEELRPYLNGLLSTSGLYYPKINGIPLFRSTDTQYLLSPPR